MEYWNVGNSVEESAIGSHVAMPFSRPLIFGLQALRNRKNALLSLIPHFNIPAFRHSNVAAFQFCSFPAFIIAFLLFACTFTIRAEEPRPLRVLTSFYPMYIHALNVTDNMPGIKTVNMVQPFIGCLHDYSMTPGDLVKIAGADVFVVNGGGMESFLDKAVKQSPSVRVLDLSVGIPLLRENNIDNPHVWLSVSNAIIQVQNLADGLARIDIDRAPAFHANAAKYIEKLHALDARMRIGLSDLRLRDIVTFHEAFPYFAQAYNLKIVAVIAREPGSEPSARELAETVDIIRRTGVKALFAEPQYPSRAASVIARETGATVYALDPAVIGPLEPDAYIEIMDRNLLELRKALK